MSQHKTEYLIDGIIFLLPRRRDIRVRAERDGVSRETCYAQYVAAYSPHMDAITYRDLAP